MEISETEEAKEQKFRNELYAPQVLDVKVAPLFSLPPDLMSLERLEKEKEEPIKSQMKVQPFYETFHTGKRLRKEEFRRYHFTRR